MTKLDYSPWYEADLDRLGKAFNPDQPRWPAGSSVGGQFAPKTTGGLGSSNDYPPNTSEHVKSILTPAEVAHLRELIHNKASQDEILAAMAPFYAAEGEAGESTLVLPPDGKVPADFFLGRTYVHPGTGEHLDLEGAVSKLMDEGDVFVPGGAPFERKAIMLIGPPAAGKSTLAENLASKGYAIVDADEAKKYIPGYNGGLGAGAVHEESSAMSKIVQAQFGHTGKNVLIQTTSHSPASASAKIDMLHKAGYSVTVVGMEIDGGEAARRMASRAIRTGRSVPAEIMAHAPQATMNTYEAVKGLGDSHAKVNSGGNRPLVTESTAPWLVPGQPVLGKSRDGGGAVWGEGGERGVRPPLQKSSHEASSVVRPKRRWLV